MEIRVEQVMSGEELRESILRRYGSREALAKAARKKGAHEARDDRMTLATLEEDPRRLAVPVRVTVVGDAQPSDIEALTGARLAILDLLSTTDRDLNVTAVAEALGRDKKNVSEDIQILEDLGLVVAERRGREKVARPRGTEIRIRLGSATS